MEVFGVAEFEPVVKIELGPFLGAPGTIYAQNLNLTWEI